MKFKHLAVLAALGMSLTSMSVWSLTRPSSKTDVNPRPTTSDPLEQKDDGWSTAVSSVGASFNGGKTLKVEGRLGHEKLVAGKDNETYLLLNIDADPSATSTTSSALNLAIVIDRS